MYELHPHTTLQSGKYKIVKTLGQGSFGITYLAEVEIAGNLGNAKIQFAVKEFFMKDTNTRGADNTSVTGSQSELFVKYRAKFKTEAMNLAKMSQYDDIVKVYDVFEENNTAYFAMEYIEGGCMDDYIKLCGKYSEPDAIDGVRAVATALKHLHDHNMVHLDLKPKNIMRRTDGKLYLIDFGLSKQYDQNGNPDSSSTIGLGTPGYAPLEQSNYKGGFAPTLDIYALGATFYKMLTGVTPPEATDIFNDGFDSLKNTMQSIGVGSATIAIVEKAMQLRKLDRYQTVDEFLSALPIQTSEIVETILEEDEDETSLEGCVPYAVLENGTLTFYYGKDKPEGAYDVEKIKVVSFEKEKEWTDDGERIKAVVFDQSFKHFRPISCAYWFVWCSELTKIVGMRDYLNTSDVTDMRCMFQGCQKLKSLDVSGFKTDNVTDMSLMFFGCINLESLDVSGFKTDNVTKMQGMFGHCKNLTSLDVSNFNTDKVTDMRWIFSDCTNLKTIYAGDGWITYMSTESEYMFSGCSSLVGGRGTKYDPSKTDKRRARIDGIFHKGYLSKK